MLKNNNLKVTRKMAVKTLKSSRRRNISITLAILLSSFMLFSVLTAGAAYFKMQRIQNIRLNGGEFDAIVYGITDRQAELCQSNPEIKRCGTAAVSGYVAKAGTIIPDVGLIWADETYWNDIMAPARKWVKGRYPAAENEIMTTEAALADCGFEGLDVGDEFTVIYGIQDEKYEKTFRISGLFDGYGPKNVFYVSEAFYKQSGFSPADVSSGRYCIDFKQDLMSPEKQEAFKNSLQLGKAQRLFFTGDFAFSVRIFAGILGLIFVTCLCAWLLIYNIMYLSVAGNIRYYGLLQTIGMTGRQIYHLMYSQIIRLLGIGMSGGIIAGGLVSFFLIPIVIKSLGIKGNTPLPVSITFHPAILLLTVLLTWATVYTAGRKPVKAAMSCSPMEALGFRPSPGRVFRPAPLKGKLLFRLAKKQLTKDWKKTIIVMLSLAAAMSVFLCVTTLITSQGAREFVYNDRNVDIVLNNNTLRQEKKEKRLQIFDEPLLKNIEKLEGVADIEPVIYTEITVPWEPDFADLWMREFYETWMTIPYEDEIEEYKTHPENFGSSLVGITQADFEALNKSLDNPVDEDSFLKGRACLLYRDTLNLKDQNIAGKSVTCAEYGNPENTRTFKISGFTDTTDFTALTGYPPTIIVSDSAVKEFTEDPIICKLGIRYEEEYDEKTESRILSAVDQQTKDYSYESKIELMNNVKEAQGSMMEIGIGVVFILALIGVTNYINTLSGSIKSRVAELTTLESIGMTGKQMKKMLALEGLLYAGGGLFITGTLGTAVTYILYQSMNYMHAAFRMPVLPVLGSVILVLLICAFVPTAVYESESKSGTGYF